MTTTVERPATKRKTDTGDRPRTAAATEARQRKAACRQATTVALQVDLLDDVTLARITELLMMTCLSRGMLLPGATLGVEQRHLA